MITELTLLKLFLEDRDVFVRYGSFVKHDALHDEARVLLSHIGIYYDEFEEQSIDLDKFATWFHQIKNPDLNEVKHQIYNKIFERLEHEKIKHDSTFIKSVIAHFKQEAVKEQIQMVLQDKGLEVDRLVELLDQYQAEAQLEADKDYIPCAIDVGREVGMAAEGLRWRLTCLNECLGPLQPSFTVVAAYVNTGKTSFLASEVAYMAQQMAEGSVLWFNNEQQEGFLVQRIWSAMLNATWDQILDNYERAEKAYASKLGGDPDRIRLFDVRGKGLPYIKRMAKKYDAKLIIIDMIDKLSVKALPNGNMADQLENLYSNVRDFATVTCPVIASSQTDATVVNINRDTQEVKHQRYISMHQLKGSHVGKQGTLDALITIGKDEAYPRTRYISVPKTKTGLTTQKEVTFDGRRSLYTD